MGKRLTDVAVERLNKKTKGYVVWDAAQIGPWGQSNTARKADVG